MKNERTLPGAAALLITALLASPVFAAETGSGSAGPAAAPIPTNAPETGSATGGANTAIPEIPVGGTISGTPMTGDASKDGTATAADLNKSLKAMGYKNIEALDASGATNVMEARFLATNAKGHKVHVTVNRNTGAIVRETPAK